MMGQASWPKSSRKDIGVYTPTGMEHQTTIEVTFTVDPSLPVVLKMVVPFNSGS